MPASWRYLRLVAIWDNKRGWIVPAGNEKRDLGDYMDDIGANGWELVSVVPVPGGESL